MEYFLKDLLVVDPSRISLKTLTGKLNWTEILNRGVKERNLENIALVVNV
jgi:hypothetical protein